MFYRLAHTHRSLSLSFNILPIATPNFNPKNPSEPICDPPQEAPAKWRAGVLAEKRGEFAGDTSTLGRIQISPGPLQKSIAKDRETT